MIHRKKSKCNRNRRDRGREEGLGCMGESTGSVKGGSTNPVVTAEGAPGWEGRPGRVAGVGLPFEPSVLLNADFFTLVDF